MIIYRIVHCIFDDCYKVVASQNPKEGKGTMTKDDIRKKIKDLEQQLYLLLSGAAQRMLYRDERELMVDHETESEAKSDEPKIEFENKATNLCLQLIALRKALSMGEGAEKFLEDLPTAGELSEMLGSVAGGFSARAKDCLGKFVAGFGKGTLADSEAPLELDTETRHSYDAVKSLLAGNLWSAAKSVIEQLAKTKDVLLDEAKIIVTLNYIKQFNETGHEAAAQLLFCEMFRK